MEQKFCRDCKWIDEDGYSDRYCLNPKLGYNIITGEVKEVFCESIRVNFYNNNGYKKERGFNPDFEFCGPEGKWFEPKEEKKKNWFNKFRNWWTE